MSRLSILKRSLLGSLLYLTGESPGTEVKLRDALSTTAMVWPGTRKGRKACATEYAERRQQETSGRGNIMCTLRGGLWVVSYRFCVEENVYVGIRPS